MCVVCCHPDFGFLRDISKWSGAMAGIIIFQFLFQLAVRESEAIQIWPLWCKCQLCRGYSTEAVSLSAVRLGIGHTWEEELTDMIVATCMGLHAEPFNSFFTV